MKKLIVDCSTGEQTEVDLTPEEIAEIEAQRLKAEADRQAQLEAQAAKDAARASAEEKLAALGLNADELSALLG